MVVMGFLLVVGMVVMGFVDSYGCCCDGFFFFFSSMAVMVVAGSVLQVYDCGWWGDVGSGCCYWFGFCSGCSSLF